MGDDVMVLEPMARFFPEWRKCVRPDGTGEIALGDWLYHELGMSGNLVASFRGTKLILDHSLAPMAWEYRNA